MKTDKKAIEKIVKRNDDLVSQQGSWNSYFQDLAYYVLPRKAHITVEKSKGDRLKLTNIYDSTAIRALKIMAAGFSSSLTNPASKWFNLRTRNLYFMDDKQVQVWFKDVEDIIFGALASSNFDTTMQEFYLNAGAFGTGTILTLEDVRDKIRFAEIPIEQCVFEEDAYGRVNRVYRSFKLTAQQAFDLWNNPGEAVIEMQKKKPLDKMDFLHYVGPRDERDPGKDDNLNLPFKSLYIEKSKMDLIEEGGFRENPYAVGRFYKDSSEVMGFSPAMDVFNDIKLVNAQVKTLLRSAMKQADPPLIAPRKGFIAPLNTNPSHINYFDGNTMKDAIVPFPTGGNNQLTLEVIQKTQSDIEKAFFVPLFQALSNITKQMTVPEVNQRISEVRVLLGPVVGRFTQEVLDPIIMRVFSILFRQGEIPQPPPEIAGQDLDIVYISPLAKAQRESAIYDIEAFMQDVGMIATAIPQVIDKLDGDKALDIIAKIRGINPDIIKSDKDVSDIRSIRAEQQAQMARMQMMQQGADIVKTGSDAAKNLKTETPK